MRLSRLIVLATGSLLIAACGVRFPFVPTPTPDPVGIPFPEEFIEPPPLSINGVEGKPITWCWATACVDGVAPPSTVGLPVVRPPFVMALPEGARVDAVMSFGRGPTGLDDPQPLDVVGNDIQFIPVDAVALSVFVSFDQGGDALYYWAVAPPGQ